MADQPSGPPPFGAQLRRLRTARELSLKDLGERVSYSKSYLSKLESGLKPPTPELARLLDRALGADGALADLVPARTGGDAGDADRGREAELWTMHLRPDGSGEFQAFSRDGLHTPGASAVMAWRAPHPTEAPARLDGYRRMLQDLRALGQESHPAEVFQLSVAATNALRQRAARSAEADRTAVLLLAARFAEFAGWMAQENEDADGSLWWTRHAVRLGADVGDREMESYALVRASEIALYRDDPLGIRTAAQAALDHAGGPRVQAFALQRLAQGHALEGDEAACLRALEAAATLMQRDQPEPAEGPPLGSASVRDPIPFAYGWCLQDLGRHQESAEVLMPEFARVPPGAHRARARYGARLALALASQRELEAACAVARPTIAAARLVDSATVRTDLRRLARQLSRWRQQREVRQIMPDLQAALRVY